jgi:hypothetical protein
MTHALRSYPYFRLGSAIVATLVVVAANLILARL